MTECVPIAKLVREAIGFDPESTGAGTFAQVIRAEMKCDGRCGPCVERLRGSPGAFQALLDRVVVPETWFFRDPPAFALLASLAGEWKRARPLRILSAPCATGEEPYSIVMALLDAGLAPGRFQVDAADISARALDAARRAVYGKASFREGPPNGYFTREDGEARLSGEISSMVCFRQANLADPAFLSEEAAYDFVFCRNVLIYLSGEARRIVFENLQRLLARDGVLFTGHAELAALEGEGDEPLSHQGAWAGRRARAAGSVSNAAPRPVQKSQNPARPGRIEPVAGRAALETGPSAPTEAASSRLEDARRLADAGEIEKASVLCDEVLKSQPLSADAYFLKGLIEEARGSARSAEECFRKALYLNPNHYDTLLHMSVLQSGAQARLYSRRAQQVSEAEAQNGG